MPAVSSAADLGEFVRSYLQRVVNSRDLTSFADLVAPDYRGEGHGWPADRDALRAFYEWQAAERPDWRIDVQETVAVGEWVAVRAYAGGTVPGGKAPQRRDVEWLAAYRVVVGRVAEIRVLTLIERTTSP